MDGGVWVFCCCCCCAWLLYFVQCFLFISYRESCDLFLAAKKEFTHIQHQRWNRKHLLFFFVLFFFVFHTEHNKSQILFHTAVRSARPLVFEILVVQGQPLSTQLCLCRLYGTAPRGGKKKARIFIIFFVTTKARQTKQTSCKIAKTAGTNSLFSEYSPTCYKMAPKHMLTGK